MMKHETWSRTEDNFAYFTPDGHVFNNFRGLSVAYHTLPTYILQFKTHYH